MKKNLLKIAALALAAIMLLAMGMTALAAANTPTSGNSPAVTVTAATTATVNVPKDIVLFNTETSQILEPNVTYTYKIAAATVATGTTVTGKLVSDDSKTGTVAVKSGVADGVKIKGNATDASYVYNANTTLTFGTNNTTKNDTNKEGDTVSNTSKKVTQNLSLQIDATTIYNSGANTAGVYRYVLTDETTDDTLLEAGIKRDANYNKTLYLDVYLRNNNTYSGLEVYGYVLFKNTTDGANQSFEYGSSVTSETIKVSGFDTSSETGLSGTYNSGTGIISDQYHTYNVEIKKVITGAFADMGHQFPFKVEITNVASTISGYTSQITSQADFYYVATQSGTAGAETIVNLDATGNWTLGDTLTSSALKFKDGDGILITGLPANCLVKVSELNDTSDVYTASVKDEADATLQINSAKDSDNLTATTGTAVMDAAKAIDNTTAKDAVTVTNTLDAVSPTGVVLRYAPYLLMAAAAVVLLMVMSRRRKDTQDKESSI